MRVILNNLKVPVSYIDNDIINMAKKMLDEKKIGYKNIEIYRKSLDARRENNIHYLCSVVFDAEVDGKWIELNPDFKKYEPIEIDNIVSSEGGAKKVIVIGTGPCGLFSAYILAKSGLSPIVFERGADVDTRTKIVEDFWKNNKFNPETNVQFGEGGAGTFSDGKLTTRIGDPLQRVVLETFVKFGAPEDILYKAKPHIGTDKLKAVVKNMRKEIERLGGVVKFNSTVTNIVTENNELKGVIVNNCEEYPCDALVLAIGHSSRDTYAMLKEMGIKCEAKAFAAGVRIEHTQEFINKMQYGKEYKNPLLPPADYRLTYNGEERSCYSFCMCPGGTVVNASSEGNMLVVNGMSEYKRDGRNANSALVVTVKPSDFDSADVLAGIEFQRKYESLAYNIAKGKAPVQLARDFAENKISKGFNGVKPTFTGEFTFADLRECLPEFICDTLKDGLLNFEKRIKGYTYGGAVLTGVETRTSAPLRILRDENYESVSLKGLYPAGEGAGYAGGIMSAAVDGIKIALKICQI